MLLTSSWRDTRRAVLKHGSIPEFTFRQYLFACQADVLLKLARPQEARCFALIGSAPNAAHFNPVVTQTSSRLCSAQHSMAYSLEMKRGP